MTCGKCDAHMTGAQYVANTTRQVRPPEEWPIYPHDHYCTATPLCLKIKSAINFSGQERPRWCPRREALHDA